MNRRRTAKRNLGFGSILLLVVAAVVISSAGVFHAYIKNRQINVSREIERVENLISQHELDIKTDSMLLGEQLNRFLIRDRLKEFSSDLREIPRDSILEIRAYDLERLSSPGQPALAGKSSLSSPDPPSSAAASAGGLAHGTSPPGISAMASAP